MPYNNIISRTDAAALIPEDVATAVIGRVTEESASLTMMRRIPVAQSQTRIPVLSALPVAYFVNGDTGLKQTTEMAWANKFLNVEEIAAILPIPEAVLDDASFDVWGEIRPAMEEAIGRALDAAVFFGVNKPASWPADIVAAATAAGNAVAEGAAATAGGIQGDLDAAFSAVEDDGYDVNGIVAARSLRGRLRTARDANGNRLDGVGPALNDYLGVNIAYPMRGLFPAGGAAGTNVRAFVGDFSQFVLGVRQDITYKILDQAVIQDNTGAIVYNLAQQDMVAMRVVFRVGWQVANILNYDRPADADRYPAAVLTF